MNCAIGLDLGGTNVKALAVTPSGQTLAEIVSPSGNRNWQAEARNAIQKLRRAARRPIGWIGVAAPGLPSKDQRSIAHMPGRLPGLEGLIWSDFLKTEHTIPVLNDAHAALLGEVWRGAARRCANVALLTLGTGVGGAAMVDGHLLRGYLGRAGHLGHVSLDPRGARDIVNTPGSLEDLIGDCTIERRSHGRFRSTVALVAAVRRGDQEARHVWLTSIQALAAAIVSFINVLDPERVIIGGGIAQAGTALLRPLKDFLDKFEWRPDGARVRIVSAKLGDRAGAFGAAWNAIHFNPHASAE